MQTFKAGTLWKPDGTKFRFEIDDTGNGAIYEFGTGQKKGPEVAIFGLDGSIDTNDFNQNWSSDRVIGSAVYVSGKQKGQCLAQLLP